METIKVDSQLNGKFRRAILGWLNANCCIGDGADKTASTTIFNKSPRQIQFHIKTTLRLSFV